MNNTGHLEKIIIGEGPNAGKPVSALRTGDLFADLVAKFGEANGGTEDFFVHSDDRIGCRYADLSMHRRADGWHYGRLPEAYPTPAECYAHWREDDARFHSANIADQEIEKLKATKSETEPVASPASPRRFARLATFACAASGALNTNL